MIELLMPLLAFAAALGVFGLVWWLVSHQSAKRLDRHAAWAQARGWQYTADDRAALSGFDHEHPFNLAARAGSQWSAIGRVAGRSVKVGDFGYSTIAMGSRTTFAHPWVLVDCPRSWPALSVCAIGNLASEPADFDVSFAVQTDSSEFARELLSYRVRQLLSGQFVGLKVMINSGRLLVTTSGYASERSGLLDRAVIGGSTRLGMQLVDDGHSYADFGAFIDSLIGRTIELLDTIDDGLFEAEPRRG